MIIFTESFCLLVNFNLLEGALQIRHMIGQFLPRISLSSICQRCYLKNLKCLHLRIPRSQITKKQIDPKHFPLPPPPKNKTLLLSSGIPNIPAWHVLPKQLLSRILRFTKSNIFRLITSIATSSINQTDATRAIGVKSTLLITISFKCTPALSV